MAVIREKLKVGDKIQFVYDSKIIRKITEVRKTGYTWIYPDIPDKDFVSENSNDPFFSGGML